MTSLALLGGGGHASNVLGIIEDLREQTGADLDVVAIVDDDWDIDQQEKYFAGRCDTFLSGIESAATLNAEFIGTVAFPSGRRKVVEQAIALGMHSCDPLIHPAAFVGRQAKLGTGSSVNHFASIGLRARLGQHCYVATGAIIAHDVEIADFSTVLTNARVALSGRTFSLARARPYSKTLGSAITRQSARARS